MERETSKHDFGSWFSEIWAGLRLTNWSLTTKSSARITSASVGYNCMIELTATLMVFK